MRALQAADAARSSDELQREDVHAFAAMKALLPVHQLPQ
jgi:hypothetical protein